MTVQLANSDSPIVEVPFDGDTLAAIPHGHEVWVVVKRVCEALGVGYAGQHARLKTSRWATVEIISTVDPSGRRRPTLCIPLKRLAMWLATIDAGRVGEHARAKIERYQLEAADALHAYFYGGARNALREAVPRPAPVPAVVPDYVTRGELAEHMTSIEVATRGALERGFATLTAAVSPRLEAMCRNTELLVRGSPLGGRISVDDLCTLRALVARIARTETETGTWRRRSTASLDVVNRLREQTGFGGKNEKLEYMPVTVVPKALSFLRTRLDAAERAKATRNSQGDLF